MVCLVSRQAMANIIPVLELRPDKVILLTTPQESSVADNISNLLHRKEISVQIHQPFIDAYDLLKVKDECENIINSNPEQEIILNATGGTKLMSFAALDVFRKYNKTIIYNDTENSIIRYLYPEYIPPQHFQQSITVEDYLLAHGYVIQDHLKATGRAESKSSFFSNFSKRRLSEFIRFYSQVKSQRLLDRPLQGNNPNITFSFQNYSLTRSQNDITITDNISRAFFTSSTSQFKSGDWLEDLLYLHLRRSEHYDITYGVTIRNLVTGVENEIDVLLTHQYNLFLYSCKDRKSPDQAREGLYQLEALKSLVGGTFGRAILVLTRENENLTNIGKLLNIKTINIVDLLYG